MKGRHALYGLLALLLCALAGDAARANPTIVGQAVRNVLIAGVMQTSINALNLPAGSTCDGGVCTIAGGGIDAGTYMAPPAGASRGYPLVADGDGGQPTIVPTLTIDPSTGNVTAATGVTFDGRDISVDGTKLDGLPTAAVAVASVVPQRALDAGGSAQIGIQLVIQATGGATYSNDAAYMMSACSVAVPTNQVARFVIQWVGTHYTQWDAGAAPTGYCTVRRTYSVRNTNGVLTTPNALLGETDAPAGTTCTGGAVVDGGVVQPYPQGPAATLVRWECTIEQLSYTTNP